MAKKKKKQNKKKKNQKKLSFKQWMMVLGSVAALIVFLSTTVIAAIGMLPTAVAALVDRHPGKNKTFTVGAMNFAGCFPYFLDVWIHGRSMHVALEIISDPKAIIVMYAAAAFGYAISAVVTFMVSVVLIQKSEIRLKKITQEKEALIERWGKDVNVRQSGTMEFEQVSNVEGDVTETI